MLWSPQYAPGNKDGAQTRVDVQHEVLIRLMKPVDWEKFVEPHLARPPVSIELPRLSKLRTVTERLSRMNFPYVRVAANNEGVLNVGSDSERGSVQVVWQSLRNIRSTSFATVVVALSGTLILLSLKKANKVFFFCFTFFLFGPGAFVAGPPEDQMRD